MRKASGVETGSPLFATYPEARQAANRQNARDAESGIIAMVEQSPYGGGYVVRSWPVDMLADLDVRPLIHGRRPSYASMGG